MAHLGGLGARIRGVAVLAACAAWLAACATPGAPGPGGAPLADGGAGGQVVVGDPYEVNGVWYYPQEQPDYDETGLAGVIDDGRAGQTTASGEPYDPSAVTAEHTTLPMPVMVEITNLDTGAQLAVRVNDRGPFTDDGQIIAVSRAAAEQLGFGDQGLARVRVRYLGPGPLGDPGVYAGDPQDQGAYPPPEGGPPGAAPPGDYGPAPMDSYGPAPADAYGPAPPPQGIGRGGWTVQAGSFVVPANARRAVALLSGVAPAEVVECRSTAHLLSGHPGALAGGGGGGAGARHGGRRGLPRRHRPAAVLALARGREPANVRRVRRGRFITLEGGEGAGKSTQARRLADRLRETGVQVVQTREPGGSPGAEALRTLLVEGGADRWSPLSEVLMMYAARNDHLERVIRPALASGAWVVCDRFSDSSRAYQGAGGGVPAEVIEQLDRAVVGDDRPDLTLVFDLPVEAGLARASHRGGAARFESKGHDFHQRLRRGFLDIADAEPARCRVIDATRPVDEVAETVWAQVKAALDEAGHG